MEAARDAIGDELERFAVNTLEYIEKEARLIFEPLELPPLKVKFDGRHALVVVRGLDYREDLRHLRPYIMEFHPVLIGVDGGADALLEMRLNARHHHRRLRLAQRAGLGAAAPSWSTTCTPTGGPGPRGAAGARASSTTSSSSRARARTPPCCSPTRTRRS